MLRGNWGAGGSMPGAGWGTREKPRELLIIAGGSGRIRVTGSLLQSVRGGMPFRGLAEIKAGRRSLDSGFEGFFLDKRAQPHFWGHLRGLRGLRRAAGVQGARGAQRGSGQWLPGCAASPNRVCLRGALGPSVIYSVPAGRPVGGASEGAKRCPFPPADLRGRHLPTASRDRSWTENQRRKSESVQTATARAQNLYWTSTFFEFFMVPLSLCLLLSLMQVRNKVPPICDNHR